jgi:mono/diheme cytochrome c family protein
MRESKRVRHAAVILAVLAGALTARAQDSGRSVWEGVYTNEQADRGKTVYAESCASCHGAVLTGGETAPALAGGEFLANWNGLTAGDLVDRIRTTMPFGSPGTLSRETVTNVVTYMFRFNGFPAGAKEMDLRPEMLKQIRIEPARVGLEKGPAVPHCTPGSDIRLPAIRTWSSTGAAMAVYNRDCALPNRFRLGFE